MSIIIQPTQGFHRDNPRAIFQDPSSGTAMTAGEIALCVDSDDSRFSTTETDTQQHSWAFPVSGIPKRIRFYHEGYVDISDIPKGRSVVIALYKVSTGGFTPQEHHHEASDTEIYVEVTDPDQMANYIDGDGKIWGAVIGEHTGVPSPPDTDTTLHTDRVQLAVWGSSRLRTAHNLSGQRFRVFDDADAGEVSFERLDHPAGAWSTPTQPFGEGSNSPDIECLADGRLRCALINSDGNLQQYQSVDDGDTWSAL